MRKQFIVTTAFSLWAGFSFAQTDAISKIKNEGAAQFQSNGFCLSFN